MRKKFFAFLMALMLIFAASFLTACGNSDSSSSSSGSSVQGSGK